MIKVGINGFGRIGKCLFLQMINKPNIEICAINAPDLKIEEIEDYITHDSVHQYYKNIKVNILSKDEFRVNHHVVKLINERDASKIDWGRCEYLFEATGAYLTSKSCSQHKIDYVIITAPSKDDTNTFIYGANHKSYSNEKIISGSSCTTNCIAPFLKVLDDKFGVEECIFTTIHAATSSQYTVDVANRKQRVVRSIFNNIIPHTTGASSSVTCVLPQLKGKIHGTSVRVPVSNCSLLDINIELKDKNIKLDDVKNLLMTHPLYKIVYDICDKKLVSSDFISTTTPTILDLNACIEIGNGKFKFMLWYDNEWSYSAQLIRFVEYIFKKNKNLNEIKEKYYFNEIEMQNKGIVCRLDLNVPRVNGVVSDDFRVASTITTIKTILSKNPKYLVITSHFGRPTPNNDKDKEKYSTKFLVPILEKYIGFPVQFLPDGIHENTLAELQNGSGIYLLENLRFHKEETDYEKDDLRENSVVKIYSQMGDVFICDAFGCLHRKHMSIYGPKDFEKPRGYGNLINKEINAINVLINNKNKKILGIIGGNKIADKMPLINSLKKIDNSQVYVAGGLAKMWSDVSNTNISVMLDGYGNYNLIEDPIYIEKINNTENNVYDIGPKSLDYLKYLCICADIIFWNGSLGVIEHPEYKKGSLELVEALQQMKDKIVIIGGGETASLFPKNTENSHIYVSTGGGALLEYLQNKILHNKNLIGLEPYI